MKEITVKAYAKVNLLLDVLGKREDGYHNISTIMQAIDLCDDIEVKVSGGYETFSMGSVRVSFGSCSTDSEELPAEKDNIAYKAAWLMLEQFCPDRLKSVKIKIEKRIPVAAGLGGGSADAATVMLALINLWDIKVELKDLIEIGARIGADIPFQLAVAAKLNPHLGFSGDGYTATCALAEGIGEIITPLISLSVLQPNAAFLIVKPQVSLKTADIYRGIDTVQIPQSPDTGKAVLYLKNNKGKNRDHLLGNMINVLENVTFKEYPIVMYTKNKLLEYAHPKAVLMSGSGPSVFALFDSNQDAAGSAELMRREFKEVFLVGAI